MKAPVQINDYAKVSQSEDIRLLCEATLSLIMDFYDPRERPELVLAEKHLHYKTIARILNKKPDAVRMLIKRWQKKSVAGERLKAYPWTK